MTRWPDPHDILRHWLDNSPYAEHTKTFYRREITTWIHQCKGHVWQARPRDVIDYTAHLENPRTAAWTVSALDSYYRHAQELDHRLANPVHHGMRPPVDHLPPGRLRLTPPQVATFLSALDRYTGTKAHPTRALGYLILGMNLRAFQAVALDIDDLIREQHRTTAKITLKGGGTELQEVPPQVALALHDYLPHRTPHPPHSTDTTGPLITSKHGRRLDSYNTPKTMLRVVAASHPLLADLTPHITSDGLAASPSPFTN